MWECIKKVKADTSRHMYGDLSLSLSGLNSFDNRQQFQVQSKFDFMTLMVKYISILDNVS